MSLKAQTKQKQLTPPQKAVFEKILKAVQKKNQKKREQILSQQKAE